MDTIERGCRDAAAWSASKLQPIAVRAAWCVVWEDENDGYPNGVEADLESAIGSAMNAVAVLDGHTWVLIGTADGRWLCCKRGEAFQLKRSDADTARLDPTQYAIIRDLLAS